VATVALDDDARRELALAVDGLQWWVTTPVATSVAQRRALYSSLAASLGPHFATVVGPELVAAHARAAKRESAFAGVVRGLESGALQIVPWFDSAADATSMERAHLGVARAGQVNLGLWPLAVVALIGVVVAAGVGIWVLADTYLETQKIKADADALRAQTAAKVTSAVTALSATNPAAAVQLSNALTAANRAAQAAPPTVWQQLSGAVSSAAGTAVLLGLLWYAYRNRRSAA